MTCEASVQNVDLPLKFLHMASFQNQLSILNQEGVDKLLKWIHHQSELSKIQIIRVLAIFSEIRPLKLSLFFSKMYNLVLNVNLSIFYSIFIKFHPYLCFQLVQFGCFSTEHIMKFHAQNPFLDFLLFPSWAQICKLFLALRNILPINMGDSFSEFC
jgi:hypothetical protein